MVALLLAVVVVAALAGAGMTESVCPAECVCSNGDELEYACELTSTNLTVTARPRDYVNIDCEGGELTCDEFPDIAIGEGKTVPSIGIRDCSLPANLSCILRRLQVADVEVLTLNKVLTRLQPETLSGLRALRALMLFNAAVETSVPVDVLTSLPALRHFRLCGGNLTLVPEQFQRSSPLTYLELSTDGIEEVPVDTFSGLRDLRTLNFWGNSVVNISGDALRGLSQLEQLSLNTNKLRYLPPGLFSHTPALKTLSLVRNFLPDLRTPIFQGLAKLEEVTISNDVELKLHPKVFANLPALKSLKLDRSGINKLPADMFANSTSLTTLSIAQNKLRGIPKMLFKDQHSLETLDLSYNEIGEVTAEMFISLKSLQELRLDRNKIELLPDQLFSGLRNLKSVSISGNGLKTISPNSFQGAGALERLSLSRNQLTLVSGTQPAQYNNLELYSPFDTLLKLTHLDLKMNNISRIFDDWKNVLLSLDTLDLSWNQFIELTTADVQFLSTNIEVDLRHNNISTIYLSAGFEPDTQSQQTTQSVILLEDNPLTCDCYLYTFVSRLHGMKPFTAEPEFRLGDTRCSGPDGLESTPIEDVTVDQLYCKTNCTDACSCKIRPASKTLELYCDSVPLIPAPSEYGLEKTFMKLLDVPPAFKSIPDHVDSMDLSGLGLKELPFDKVPPTLKMLDLRNNELSEVPLMLLNRNLSLKLSGNGIVCSCWRADDISSLMMHRDFILDFDDLMCTDGNYVAQVDASRLCDVVHATAVGSVLATVGVFVAIAAALLYRYSLEVRVYIYAKGWLRWLLPEEKLDESKKYDIFISFSHKDEDFVRDELLEKLEPEFKICVHYRDWVVGDMIPTQIANSVEQSRRTVVVLSRNFLASLWAMNEFRTAHALAVKEKNVRVIVILLEDCLHLGKEHEELKAYLSTNTYIKWDDPMFWDRLRYALPQRKRRAPGVVGGGKIKLGGLNGQLNSEGQLINAAFKESV